MDQKKIYRQLGVKKIPRHKEKLSVRDGILWLGRTISSEKIMNKILKRLHEEHPGTINGYCKKGFAVIIYDGQVWTRKSKRKWRHVKTVKDIGPKLSLYTWNVAAKP